MTFADLFIRDLYLDDIDRILDLEQQTPGAPHWQRGEYEKIFEATDILRRRGVVAVTPTLLVGFAIAKALIVGSHMEAELETIVVQGEARRRGIGRLLIAALLRRIVLEGDPHSRLEVLRLEVRSSNSAAVSLYEDCGFRPAGVRRRYYRDPEEDGLLMELSFPVHLQLPVPKP